MFIHAQEQQDLIGKENIDAIIGAAGPDGNGKDNYCSCNHWCSRA